MLLGYTVAQSTVSKYMSRTRKEPSRTWRDFLKNHAAQIAACDSFVVPTATFSLLCCFVTLDHKRRRILHANVTRHPTAAWAAQRIVNAFPDDTAPKRLVRSSPATVLIHPITCSIRIRMRWLI